MPYTLSHLILILTETVLTSLFYRDGKWLTQSCSKKVWRFIWTKIYVTPNVILLSPHQVASCVQNEAWCSLHFTINSGPVEPLYLTWSGGVSVGLQKIVHSPLCNFKIIQMWQDKNSSIILTECGLFHRRRCKVVKETNQGNGMYRFSNENCFFQPPSPKTLPRVGHTAEASPGDHSQNFFLSFTS